MKVIIIGGAATGMGVAAKLKRQQPDSEIIVVQNHDYVSLGACGLPYYIGNNFEDVETLIARKNSAFEEQGIKVFINSSVTDVDFKNKKVFFNNHWETYDQLVIATGASPLIPKIKNVDANNIHTLHSKEDGIKIKDKLFNNIKVVVVGSGLIGLEVIENINSSVNAKVSVVEKANRVVKNIFDEEFTSLIEEEMANRSIYLYKNTEVSEFLIDEKNNVTGVKLSTGEVIECDLVILSIGVRPNTDFLINKQINLDNRNNILINEYCETSVPDVYAGGDCCSTLSFLYNQQRNFYLATVANKHAKIIATNLVSKKSIKFNGAMGTTIVRFFELELTRSGENQDFIDTNDIKVKQVLVKDKDHTNYVSGQTDLWIKISVDLKTNTIINVQMMGHNNAVLRIYALIAMMWSRAKVDGMLEQIDLPYSPPFSRTSDIIHIALSKLV